MAFNFSMQFVADLVAMEFWNHFFPLGGFVSPVLRTQGKKTRVGRWVPLKWGAEVLGPGVLVLCGGG